LTFVAGREKTGFFSGRYRRRRNVQPALDEGTVLPFGGPMRYAVSLGRLPDRQEIADLLLGVLSGAAFGP